jgi:hypothetical protein
MGIDGCTPFCASRKTGGSELVREWNNAVFQNNRVACFANKLAPTEIFIQSNLCIKQPSAPSWRGDAHNLPA